VSKNQGEAPYHPKNRVKKDPLFLSYSRVYVIPLLPVFDDPILVGNNIDTHTVYFYNVFPLVYIYNVFPIFFDPVF